MKLNPNVKNYKDNLKSIRAQWFGSWGKIRQFVKVGVRADEAFNYTGGERQDIDVVDNTVSLATSQAADSFHGIIWGTGQNAITLKPIHNLKRTKEITDFFTELTYETLFQMNHEDTNLSTFLKTAGHSNQTYGNGGNGVFKNPDYGNPDTNLCECKSYGVESCYVGEGKNGKVNTLGMQYRWTLQEVVATFGREGLPEAWQKMIQENKLAEKVKLENLILPSKIYGTFVPDAKEGIGSAKYVGVWFDMDKEEVFHTDYYKKHFPIPFLRINKQAGDMYGRSATFDMLSTILQLNYAKEQMMNAIDKSLSPAMAVYQGVLNNGNILDVSAKAINVLNSITGIENPIPQRITDVQDISGIVQILIPELKGEIMRAYKLDALLDLTSQTEKTATEINRAYMIRANSIMGQSTQMKNDLYTPTTDLFVWHIMQAELIQNVPQEIQELIKKNRPWYTVQYNNEITRIENAERLNTVMSLDQYIGGLAQLKPEAVEAKDVKKSINYVNKILNPQENLVVDDNTYEDAVDQLKKNQAIAQGTELANVESDTDKNKAQGKVNDAKARNQG
jgi:hypothetical protein